MKTIKINENGTIPCPQCGNDFVHFHMINFRLPDMNKMSIDHDGNVSVITEKEGSGEHYYIELIYCCENGKGHTGVIRISHHEGFMYIEHEAP
jgi:hypothetical protein